MPEFVLAGRGDPRFQRLDAFTQAYVEAAFFTEEENLGLLTTVAFQQLSDQALARMVIDCAQFQRRAREAEVLPECSCCLASAGHDFWLTRNRHGGGFWDGDWSEPAGSRLDEIAKTFPEIDLYRGRDGAIHS